MKASLRITLVTRSLAMGGAEKVIAWLASQLAAAGHRVSLVVMSPPETDFFTCDPRVAIVRIGHQGFARQPQRKWLRRWASRLVPRIIRLIRAGNACAAVRQHVEREQADVVISFQTDLNLAMLMAMRGSAVPVIVSERSNPFLYRFVDPLTRWLHAACFSRAAAVSVLSAEVARKAQVQWCCPRPVITPNPVTLRPASVPESASRGRTVLCVGRLHREKNHLALVKAWAMSAAPRAGWTLRIVGDGPERPAIAAMIAALEPGASISLEPATAAVEQHYREAAIFALPSLVEGFPNALLEAMACGCASIASDCSGAISSLLGDGAGVIVPRGNVPALAAGIDRLVADDALRERMAQAARLRSAEFSEETVFAIWSDLIERTVAESNVKVSAPPAVQTNSSKAFAPT